MLRLFCAILIVGLIAACTQPSGPEATIPVASSTSIIPTPGLLTVTPTQEHLGCDVVPIEYIVVIDSLRVRTGPGTTFVIVGALTRGDTFIGDLCDEVANGFIWVEIKEHPTLAGRWTALGVVGGTRYLN